MLKINWFIGISSIDIEFWMLILDIQKDYSIVKENLQT